MAVIRVKCHGVNYVRVGECIQCGACSCSEKGCPHFSWSKSLATCSIQQAKTDICVTCTNDEGAYFYRQNQEVSHQICEDFPNHPFLRVIKSGVCGYTFKPATGKDRAKHQVLIDAWQ